MMLAIIKSAKFRLECSRNTVHSRNIVRSADSEFNIEFHTFFVPYHCLNHFPFELLFWLIEMQEA